MFSSNDELIRYLKGVSSEKLKKFNEKIIATEMEVIGCTMPKLREIACCCAKEDFEGFCAILECKTFEEIMLRGLAIGYADIPLEKRMAYLDEYLLLADNWAHIDCAVSTYKFIAKYRDVYLAEIERYLYSDKPFFVRYALVCLLSYYVDEKYLPYIFNALEKVDCAEYYVSMAAAWLISICYVKHALSTEKFLAGTHMDAITVNRAIGKICDSLRVSRSDKEKMKKIKRKI